MGPADFLTTLWGPDPGGLIQIWELTTKRSRYYRSPTGTTGLAGRTDVYTGVALAHKDHGRNRRARADQALAIPGLWLDLDIDGGPEDKTGGIADLAAAASLSRTIIRPTLVISSGYGIHAWYLLDQPWIFTSRQEQHTAALASAQWFALHRQAANHLGFGVDHAHDLARLLRLPGTLNGKGGGAQPVEPIYTSGPRYPRAQLLELAAQAGDVPIGHGSQLELAGDVKPIEIRRLQAIPPKVDALIFNDPDFAATWRHERSEHWSLSEYDMSLCNQAAQAGFTDQELADLIGLHRSRHGDGKGARVDYLRRTIAKARQGAERTDAAHTLAQLRRAA